MAEKLNQSELDELLADTVHFIKHGRHLNHDVHHCRRSFCKHVGIDTHVNSRVLYDNLLIYYFNINAMDRLFKLTEGLNHTDFEVSRPEFFDSHIHQMLH